MNRIPEYELDDLAKKAEKAGKEGYLVNHNFFLVAEIPRLVSVYRELVEENKRADEEIENILHSFQMIQMENTQLKAGNEHYKQALEEIAHYERDQYESSLYAYDNCKIIAQQALKSNAPEE